VKIQAVDIVNYVNGQKYPCHKLYFSPDEYPLTLGCLSSFDLRDVSSWIALKRAFLQAAHDAGNPLLSHGKGGCNEGRVFRCICFRVDKTTYVSAHTATDYPTTAYRMPSMVNNDKSNRGCTGKNLPRRMKGFPATLKCPFLSNVS
jgi:hypothetical protein